MSGVALGAVAGIGFGLFQAVNRRVNAVVDVYRGTFGLLAVTQLAAPTVAIVSPWLSGERAERGGRWLWSGIALIVAGSVILLLRG